MSITIENIGPVRCITMNNPQKRNAVDGPTAALLAQAFRDFDQDESAKVAVFYGVENFCAGADLKAISRNDGSANTIEVKGDGPMGPSRMLLSKPVIAAIEGYAVAGGLELAVWCDLRVLSEKAVLGVFCRRFGVPLVDGGTIRLPRLIGMSRALDLILTGRPVDAQEAKEFGLANRVVPEGEAKAEAIILATEIAQFPELCMKNDRLSVYQQWNMGLEAALVNESELGLEVISKGETFSGASRFADGEGKHGKF